MYLLKQKFVCAAALVFLILAFNTAFAADSVASNTPESILHQLADELEAGDTSAALKHFSANSNNRHKLESLTPEMKIAMSKAFRSATLLRSEVTTRIYSLQIIKGEKSVTTEIGLVQIPSGEWYVMYW